MTKTILRNSYLSLLKTFAVAAAISLAGCATVGSGGDSSSAERKLPAKGCRFVLSGEVTPEFANCDRSREKDGRILLNPEVVRELREQAKAAGISLDSGRPDDSKTPLSMFFFEIKTGNVIFPEPAVAYVDLSATAPYARLVVFFDNGPDYFEEDLARYIDGGGMIGHINRELKIVIPAAYDFVAPFDSGRAAACTGCASHNPNNDEHGGVVTGGSWVVIDRKGKVIRGPGLTATQAYEFVRKNSKNR